MNLYKRMVLIVVSTIILLMITLLCIYHFYFLNLYEAFEDEYIEEHMNTLSVLEDNFLRKYELIAKDWGYSDELYKFISTPNEQFIEENFNEQFYKAIGITYIIVLDKSNDIVYGSSYDNGTIRALNDDEMNMSNYNGFDTNLFYYDSKSYAFSSRRVNNSAGDGVVNGSILFGFEINEEHFNEIGSAINLDFLIEYCENGCQYGVTSEKTSNSIIYSINYPYDNDNGSLRAIVETDRNLIDTVKKAILPMIVITVLLLVGAAIVMLLLMKFIYNTIKSVTSQIEKIEPEKDITKRIHIKGDNDITKLANKFNALLDSLQNYHDKMIEIANVDPLTGTLNRRKGMIKLENNIKRLRNKQELYIAFVDINDLKNVNDTFGHNIGDEYISTCSNIILNNIRKTDFISRFGGDEFLIVFNNIDRKKSVAILNRIEKELSKESKTRKYNMSISYGIEKYRENMDVDSLIEKADEKMYRDKKRKKIKRSK